MKYKILAVVLSSLISAGAVSAETKSQAMATWQAVAKKDTTSKLVVTPLGSLSFQYAEGVDGFNKQKGLFDVAISGDATSTAFKLTSRLVSNTLTQLDKSGSTLTVGVNYYEDELTEATDTVMIDTADDTLGGNLSPLSSGFKEAGRVTAQDAFTFSIIGGTSDGTTPITDYSTLPEGIWSGDVSVRFDAVWTS